MHVEFTNGVAQLKLTEPREMEVIRLAAEVYANRLAEAELQSRVYHLGKEPTPGKSFDDRLTVRLSLSRSTIMGQLDLYRTSGGKLGGLRYTWVGRYLVSEAACLEFLGDKNASH
ncbi:hypothetical protein GKZ68_10280 [Hymenobacter sp. BRD128]|uniref:hypothetical protein n=1 Tax=Hymenobacter sp. BRD128 TaxID=2675878 RepID=UPI00156358C7|nr:hypothetical protein [Hymenobacter sp. BRD128]QKG56977.1 hypothetical protein GKZ68_10280 [Hymenobacter sp. BRD128]